MSAVQNNRYILINSVRFFYFEHEIENEYTYDGKFNRNILVVVEQDAVRQLWFNSLEKMNFLVLK